MTSTAAIGSSNRLAQSASGRPDSDPAQSQDFIAALNRLAYASLSAAAVPFDTTIPDTTAPDTSRTAPANDTDPPPAQANRNADRTREPKDDAIAAKAPDAQPVSDETRPNDGAPEAAADRKSPEHPATNTQSEASPPPDAAEAAAVSQAVPIAQQSQNPQPAATKQAAQQPAANSPQTQAAQPANAQAPETKQPGAQAPGRDATPSQTQISAQVTDSGDGDRLPQIGHTLSSRSALVAQSDTARTGTPADGAPKNTPADTTAASLFTGVAQPNGQAAKSKGQAKTGNGTTAASAAASAPQTGGASANQAVAANAQPAAAALPLQQPKLAPTAAAAADGLSAGTSQTGNTRSEPFTLAGDAPTTSQFGTRSAAPAQAAKPPMPVPARFITNQVAVQIQKAFGEGGDRISIQLKPAELGRVEVRLDVGKEGRVSAVITADRSDTLDLLQRDARILQNALQDAGLQADSNSLSFELKSQSQAFTQSSDGGASNGGDGGLPDVTETAAAFARQNIIAQDRIDIRV